MALNLDDVKMSWQPGQPMGLPLVGKTILAVTVGGTEVRGTVTDFCMTSHGDILWLRLDDGRLLHMAVVATIQDGAP